MKIAVYGVGNNFTRNYKWISENYEICALFDGSEDKQGRGFMGMSVQKPDEIKKCLCDRILVTPNARVEIVNFLLGKGISIGDIIFLSDVLPSDDAGKELKIGFRVVGGMGDALIALNYIYAFHKMYSADHIKFYLETIKERNGYKALISDDTFFNDVIDVEENDVGNKDYHLLIRIQRYPEILYSDKPRIARLKPELIDYVLLLEKYKLFNHRYFEKDFVGDGVSAAYESICGRKRITQPDVYNHFGMTEDYLYDLKVDKSALGRFNLNDDRYISIHRGTEEKNFSNESTKLWPIEKYNKLFDLIRERIPDYEIVLVGTENEKKQELDFSGVDLRGKTTLSELAEIVGSAAVHIDTEGGVVHLRHAVSSKTSIVLFGPTSDSFFGYSENVNIRSSACPYPCEWVSEDWQSSCIREENKALCMEAISPQTVLDAIISVLER